MTPQKHHGVLRGIRRRMGGWSVLAIDGYITQMQVERDQDAMPRVHDGWSSEDDITPEEDSGDEYLPPGATGGGDLESDLDFSEFSALEEEEEEQLFERDPDSDSDGESEGDGPAQPRRGEGGVRARGGGARRQGRGRGRGRGRGAPPSDEGWSEDPTPPVMHPSRQLRALLCQCQPHP